MMKATIILVILPFLGVTIANPIDFGGRVVGGSIAAPAQFPFIISLRKGNSHTCGGSIIKENWVVTAAHCVSGGQPKSYTVVAGSNELNSTTASRFDVEKIIVHPKYNSALTYNDIALLKLSTPIELSSLVQTVGLEFEDFDDVRNCVLIGWGRTSYLGVVPNDLQFVDLVTVPYKECLSQLQNVNPVYTSEICTLTKVGEGACNGDSGGPLIVIEDGEPKLIGLVSWGMPCAKGKPDVYTRVSSYIDWIEENIEN